MTMFKKIGKLRNWRFLANQQLIETKQVKVIDVTMCMKPRIVSHFATSWLYSISLNRKYLSDHPVREAREKKGAPKATTEAGILLKTKGKGNPNLGICHDVDDKSGSYSIL